jgi:XTP/dITP diphosphohydrolase
MEILIATGNKGKILEYGLLLADLPIILLSLADVGLDGMDVEETGVTFHENAALKALTYAKESGKITLADDSGLCVDALGGQPGVHSARYGGNGLDDRGRRLALLDAMGNVPDELRIAHFECVIALADPKSMTCSYSYGICPGRILNADADGPEGFGYDALFVPDGYDQSFAQLTKETKNSISHRANAAKELIPILKQL